MSHLPVDNATGYNEVSGVLVWVNMLMTVRILYSNLTVSSESMSCINDTSPYPKCSWRTGESCFISHLHLVKPLSDDWWIFDRLQRPLGKLWQESETDLNLQGSCHHEGYPERYSCLRKCKPTRLASLERTIGDLILTFPGMSPLWANELDPLHPYSSLP